LEIQNEALREAHLRLEESRDKYLDLFEFAPVGYFTLTDKALVTEVNLTGAVLLGIDRNKLVKAPFSKFIAEHDVDTWRRYFINVLKQGEKQISILALTRGDGSPFTARLESIRMDQGTNGPVVWMALSDITALVKAEENLAQKSYKLDELNAAYKTIADGQEKLRRNVEELTNREAELRDALAKKEQAEQDLKKKNEELNEALAEKEVLLSEIHHRVKNNLTAFISLLSLEGPYDSSPAGLALKKDLQNRARSMALIHETLYRTHKFTEVDMKEYLSTLIDQIVSSYGSSISFRTLIDVDEIFLDVGRATPIGLIINELVTNSIKYAFPEGEASCREGHSCAIHVALSKEAGSYTMRVSDNGIGLPANFDFKTKKTLGVKLVNFLAKHQLQAKIDIATDNGTEFVFRFRE